MIQITRDEYSEELGIVTALPIHVPESIKGIKAADKWLRKEINARRLRIGAYKILKVTQVQEVIFKESELSPIKRKKA